MKIDLLKPVRPELVEGTDGTLDMGYRYGSASSTRTETLL